MINTPNAEKIIGNNKYALKNSNHAFHLVH